MDILGRPDSKLTLRDSCIGHVEIRPGGVGRNIAEQIARLTGSCELYTVFGTDMMAGMLKMHCEKIGINIDHALTAEGGSCVYLCVHDETGDMLTAVNDMALTRHLSPEYAAKVSSEINDCDVCVIDTNSDTDTLIALAEKVRVPMLLDTVSCVKAERAKPIMPRLEAIKPNLYEARILTGYEAPEDCARALLDQGVHRVFISMGKAGVCCGDADGITVLPVRTVTNASVTGAGDAMCASLAVAIARGDTTIDCTAYAMMQTEKFLLSK